jgi:formate dehydrogenase subunit gamma
MSAHATIPVAEQKRLRAKMYKKHNVANIITHWFNVISWFMLLPTGVAIIASPRLGITPIWMQEWFRNMFGGTANLITFHYTVGFVWIFILLFNIFVGWRKYFVPFAIQRMLMDKDDMRWMMVKPLQMLGFKKSDPLPPQDAYNAGQKVYSYFVVLGTAGIMVSGPVMVLKALFPPIIKQIAQPMHFLSVFMIVAWLFIHVYMGAIFPEEKEAFFSMFTGKVSAWYAKNHHAKWYWEKVQEEMDWEDEVNQRIAAESQPSHANSTPE